jgi:hypothetical protein
MVKIKNKEKTFEIVSKLGATLQKSKDWIVKKINKKKKKVALKSLQVFHRLLQESDPTFALAIISIGPSKVLLMSKFRDKSIKSEAFLNSELVKQYANYLEQRVLVYRTSKLIQLSSSYKIPEHKNLKDLFSLNSGIYFKNKKKKKR